MRHYSRCRPSAFIRMARSSIERIFEFPTRPNVRACVRVCERAAVQWFLIITFERHTTAGVEHYDMLLHILVKRTLWKSTVTDRICGNHNHFAF